MKTKTVHARLGMRRSYFAPITARTPGAHPTYGTVLDMGEAVLGHLAVTYASGDIYGDDAAQMHLSKFVSGQLDSETTCDELALSAAVYGRSYVDGVETSGEDDEPPAGGFGYIEPYVRKDQPPVFRAVFFYDVKAMPEQEKSDSDTRKGDFNPAMAAVSYFVTRDETGNWRDRKEFGSEAAADAWLMSKFGAAVGYAVTTRKTGVGTISPEGTVMVASGDNLEISFSATPTKLYDNSADVTASVSNKKYTITGAAGPHDLVAIFPAG